LALVTTAAPTSPTMPSAPVHFAALTALSPPECVLGTEEAADGWLVTWSRPFSSSDAVFGHSTTAHGVSVAGVDRYRSWSELFLMRREMTLCGSYRREGSGPGVTGHCGCASALL